MKLKTLLLALSAIPCFAIADGFKVVERNGRSWLVRADGTETWSLGVCCVEPGVKWVDYDPEKPGYAAHLFYPNRAAWAGDSAQRLANWGFNTIGAWSDYDAFLSMRDSNLMVTPILHMGSSAGAPWLDMWDPKVVDLMRAVAEDQVKKFKGNSRVVGYFSDNELGWWAGALFKMTWDQGPTGGTRSRTVALLRKRYAANWSALNRDFEPVGANSFDGLAKTGRLYLRPGGSGMGAISEYQTMLAERYYSLCRSILRKADPGALFLGDRYISNFYPEIASVAGKYCDVVSTNLNADWNDGSFVRYYLPLLRRCTGRPIMITEYYMAAMQNGSGNKNDSSGFPVVVTQAERAIGFTNTTRALARTPYVVGAHWFQYTDEPQRGRGDGENYDMGLVDIQNRPYTEMTSAAAALNPAARHREGAPPRSDASGGLPTAPSTNPLDLTGWDREHAFVPPTTPAAKADLYACYRDGSLYLAVVAEEDRFPEALYLGGKVPEIDRPKLTLTVGGRSIVVRLGVAGKPVVLAGGLSASDVKCTEGEHVVAALHIPLDLSSRPQEMRAKYESRGRAYATVWAATLRTR